MKYTTNRFCTPTEFRNTTLEKSLSSLEWEPQTLGLVRPAKTCSVLRVSDLGLVAIKVKKNYERYFCLIARFFYMSIFNRWISKIPTKQELNAITGKLG